LFNVTAESAANYSGERETQVTMINVSVNSTPLVLGNNIQNAANWLETANNSQGVWESSNYSTAWAIWALNKTYGSNATRILNATNVSGTSQLTNGSWENNNRTTALMVYALRKAGYTTTTTSTWTGDGITNATRWLIDNVNNTKTMPDTAMMLAAIYTSGVAGVSTNASVVAARSWLKNNQTANGSWAYDVEKTAWGLIALIESGTTTGNNYTSARTWLYNNQNLEGYFGSSAVINDTAIATIALNIAEIDSWTVDRDNSTSTTADQYIGSVWGAMDWMLSKQNTTGDYSWNSSPSNPTVTAMGIIALGHYGTLTGNVTGGGVAALGVAGFTYNVTPANISFSDDYGAITDSQGRYSINVPAGSYTVTVTNSNFTTNTTTSFTIGNGRNRTTNFTMLPGIDITGAFGSNLMISENTVDANTGFTLSANSTYSYNTSKGVNGTYNITSSPSGISRTSTVNNITTGYMTRSLTSPSPATTTTYRVNFFINDSYGSNASTHDNLSVKGTGGTTPVSGGGGGGTSGRAIIYTQYDKSLTFTQGASILKQVTVKNSGTQGLEDVRLSILGISSNWYTINVSTTGAKTEDLSAGESVTFNIVYDIPNDATPKIYKCTLKAKDTSSYVILEKAFNITVTKVWTEADIVEVNSTIVTLKDEFKNLTEEIITLGVKGLDTTTFETNLSAINNSIQQAILKFNAGEYDQANELADEARTLLDALKAVVAGTGAPKTTLGKVAEKIPIANIAIAIVIIIIGGFAGFIVWYKLFRIVSIAEVKADPEMFVEGAKVEGVIKSITDTPKGKVFLVADATGKMHVRYPYYTTIENGNTIRARGPVKTYKGVPYMDATDIHRVTLKHHA